MAFFSIMVKYGAYPLLIIKGFVLHFLLLNVFANYFIATYVPVTVAVVIILVLERHFPYCHDWHRARLEVATDVLYIGTVQILLPIFLSFCLSIVLLQNLPHAKTLVAIWPHQWAAPYQVVLMLLISDFFRYWLHRFSHQWSPLWRLHAVHHSPHGLYSLNVGRFHPLDKSLQYLFDAMPFIIMGVGQEVLSMYYVFYAINGFFQHCNIDVRLGFLNYIISGPELHRWHHSENVIESNHNYGNNLIIWDLIFGTRYLPKRSRVAELGLINRHYPMGFISQLKSPFIKGLDKRQ